MSLIPDKKNIVAIDFKRIKAAAAASGLTVREIAARAGGITHSTVFSILTGNTNPAAVNVKKVCDVLGLRIEDVFIDKAAA
jgi:transcriptional regulator with XRE-family HTH domain